MNRLLTHEECLPAARIFLNALGFTLDENAADKLQIFDENGEAGTLYFEGNSVNIELKDLEGNILTATYKIPTMDSLVDIDANPMVNFSMWYTDIRFKGEAKNGVSIDGTFLVNARVDDEYGLTCKAGVNMKLKSATGETISYEFNNDTTFFSLIFKGKNSYGREYGEKLYAHPYVNWVDKLMVHQVNDFDYDQDGNLTPHFISNAIYQFEGEEEKEYLHVGSFEFLGSGDNEKLIYSKEETVYKEKDNEGNELVTQRGQIMRRIDPSYFEQINSLINFGFVARLFTVCYDGCSDEVLESLFGLTKDPTVYQDGSNNLVDSYYSLDKGNTFHIDMKRFRN